jgi:pyruvate kinase
MPTRIEAKINIKSVIISTYLNRKNILMRKTKIVITLGPSTSSEEMIEKLIKKGVNVFRLNFSHGDHESHAQNIQKIRHVSKKLKKEVAILQDISGPKVRIGKVEGTLLLKKGDTLQLSKSHSSDPYVLDLSYPLIIDMVNVGEEVFFADGTIRTQVIAKDSETLTLELLNDGELTSKKA